MRLEVVQKGKGLAGSSDLTLISAIKPGLVPALDAVSYKSRLKRLLKTLSLGRTSSHEYALVRPISDAVERIGKIHSVRVVVLEQEDKLLLSATFDGSWEAYFRVLWQKTGRLLDAIYCNTEGYVSAWDHTYAEWLGWARRVQRETDFFYSVPSVTFDDQRYWRDAERHALRHEADDAERVNVGRVLKPVEQVAKELVNPGTDDPPPGGDGQLVSTGAAEREIVKQGLQSLAGLYALTDLYPPGTADGAVLQRAAVEYLGDMPDVFYTELQDATVQRRFDRQVRWLEAARAEALPAVREVPALPQDAAPAFCRDDVQGGIVEPHGDAITHGALLLLAFDGPAAASSFLDHLLDPHAPLITTAAGSADSIKRNLALTMEGLRQCGLDEGDLALFPDEFRQGMAARAGQLGDLRTNHPRRWPRPRRLGAHPNDADDRIDLAAVHALLQLRVAAPGADSASEYDIQLPGHPLHAELKRLSLPGTRILAVESTRRQFRGDKVVEHFGWADGGSAPTIDPRAADARVNQVHLGELLLGYPNEADHDPPRPLSPWLHNGSFLVVRKLRQFVDRLRAAVDTVTLSGLDEETVYGKLMGRTRDGTPMVPGGTAANNNFTYKLDPNGVHCPLHAHIRRAHPREVGSAPAGRRRPRLVRRSMSYGRPFEDAPQDERGLLFMAYNASLGEQFEVVQRWLSGGNSTGSSSLVADPLLGVPESGRRRHYRFEHDGVVHRMALDGSDCLYDEARPLTSLEWGLYAFAPSMTALRRLARHAADSAARSGVQPVWDEAQGEREILRLLELGARDSAAAAEAWKQVLEDVESVRNFAAAAVWAALRQHRGGLLRTPYGVLVADPALVRQVLEDGSRFSVSGYRERMLRSIGENHLGLDDEGPGCPYRRDGQAVNGAIRQLDSDEAFELARGAAHRKFDSMIQDAILKSIDFEDPRYETGFDPREVVEDVLATLCEAWFGLAEHGTRIFQRGGFRWDARSDEPPCYPGHFGAPSRYIFQPRPGPEAVRWGVAHGIAVRDAALRFVRDLRRAGLTLAAPVGAAALSATDADAAARALAGAVMGMVPTLDGCLRRVLAEWSADGTLWTERARRAGQRFTGLADATVALEAPMVCALQLRPMPELLWRTATVACTLSAGNGQALPIQPGDVIVLSLVSALQQGLASGHAALDPVFGGDRASAGHPTHACPGQAAGRAALLGVLAAFVEHAGGMRPGPAAPALLLEGPAGAGAPAAACMVLDAPRTARLSTTRPTAATLAMRTTETPLLAAVAGDGAARAPAAQRTLLGWGDSWLSYRPKILGRESNLMRRLRDMGFTPDPPAPYSESGMKVASMAARPPDDAVYTMLEELLVSDMKPHALLLSAGGNDCVKNALLHYVRDSATGTRIDQPSWDAHLRMLRSHFVTIIGNLRRVCDRYGVQVPVVVHGYDHPVVDGRYLFGASGLNAWLHGWLVDQLHYDKAAATAIMKDLIDGLNGMMTSLATDPTLGKVVHVNLAGTLRGKFGGTMDDDAWLQGGYKKAWENELHPTPDGFLALAEKLKAELDAL